MCHGECTCRRAATLSDDLDSPRSGSKRYSNSVKHSQWKGQRLRRVAVPAILSKKTTGFAACVPQPRSFRHAICTSPYHYFQRLSESHLNGSVRHVYVNCLSVVRRCWLVAYLFALRWWGFWSNHYLRRFEVARSLSAKPADVVRLHLTGLG